MDAQNFANLKRLSLDELVDAGSSPHIGYRFYQAIIQELEGRAAYNRIADMKHQRGVHIGKLKEKPSFSFVSKPWEAT
jgi:hypothetical protein